MNNGVIDLANKKAEEIIANLKKLPKSSKKMLIGGCFFVAISVAGLIMIPFDATIAFALSVSGIPFALLLFGLLLGSVLKSKKKLKKVDFQDLKNDMIYGYTSFEEYRTYFTNKYMISNYHYSFVIKYSDILWIYRHDTKNQYGSIIASNLEIRLKNKGKESTQFFDMFIDEIVKHNPEVIVGFSNENKKRYNDLCKMYKQNPNMSNDQNNNVQPVVNDINILDQVPRNNSMSQGDPVQSNIPVPPMGFFEEMPKEPQVDLLAPQNSTMGQPQQVNQVSNVPQQNNVVEQQAPQNNVMAPQTNVVEQPQQVQQSGNILAPQNNIVGQQVPQTNMMAPQTNVVEQPQQIQQSSNILAPQNNIVEQQVPQNNVVAPQTNVVEQPQQMMQQSSNILAPQNNLVGQPQPMNQNNTLTPQNQNTTINSGNQNNIFF